MQFVGRVDDSVSLSVKLTHQLEPCMQSLFGKVQAESSVDHKRKLILRGLGVV